MQTLNSSEKLGAAIARLEQQQREQGQALKSEFKMAYDSLKPINLILALMREVGESSEIKRNLVNSTVGLGAGMLTKNIYEGTTRSPFKRLVGAALQYSVTKAFNNNPETVKMVGNGIVRLASLLFSRQANNRPVAQARTGRANGVQATHEKVF